MGFIAAKIIIIWFENTYIWQEREIEEQVGNCRRKGHNACQLFRKEDIET